MRDTEPLQTEQNTDKEEMGAAFLTQMLRAFLTTAAVCGAVLLFFIAAGRSFDGSARPAGHDAAVYGAAANNEAEVNASADAAGKNPAAPASSEPDVTNRKAAPAKEDKPDYQEQYQWLTEHEDLFPEGKVVQAKGNEGLTDFLYGYGHDGAEDTDAVRHVFTKLTPSDLAARTPAGSGISTDDTGGIYLENIPLLMQWDERWGYYPYGSSVIGLTGCGPTCLSMVITGLTGNVKAAPDMVARFAEDAGYYMSGTGTRWSLFTEGAARFSIRGRELPVSAASIREELDQGHPVIFSMAPGNFTDSGHFILAAGYSGDSLIIHDPNSPVLSGRLWDFDEIKDQIYGAWSFSTATQ